MAAMGVQKIYCLRRNQTLRVPANWQVETQERSDTTFALIGAETFRQLLGRTALRERYLEGIQFGSFGP